MDYDAESQRSWVIVHQAEKGRKRWNGLQKGRGGGKEGQELQNGEKRGTIWVINIVR